MEAVHRREMFAQAVRDFQTGRALEADETCRAVLACDPNHIDALNLRAVIACTSERIEDGRKLLGKILSLQPNNAQALLTLGDAYDVSGDHDDAIAVFRDGAKYHPHDVRFWRKLGVALTERGHLAEAEHILRSALQIAPDVAQIHFNLAVALERQVRLDDAAGAYRRALALEPDHADAWLNLGNVLMDLDRLAEAIASYRQVLACRPNDAKAYCNLGLAADRQGDHSGAIEFFRRSLELDPENPAAYTNIGAALEGLGRLEDAIEAHATAIRIDPKFPKAYANLAVMQKLVGRLEDAVDTAKKGIDIDPNDASARFNHAIYLLANGDLESGWHEYEWRRRPRVLTQHERKFAMPEWNGEDLNGRRLLLHAEQGLGDTLQFVRFARRLVDAGQSIVLEVQRPLLRLLSANVSPNVVGQGEPLPSHDLHLPLLSLPRVLGTRLPDVSARPYLQADAEMTARWRQRLGHADKLKVGVVWSGSPTHKHDRYRSIPATDLLPRLIKDGVRLYSLQKDPRPFDRPVLQQLAGSVTDLSNELTDFSETAAAVAPLDLVITVDTAVAHLAGALGRPVWVLLPLCLDWRWLKDREDSPWYGSMRLFRQTRPLQWAEPVERVTAALDEWVGARTAEACRAG
jgi:tetratricopeptide (TPR) repeat protein